MRGILFAGILLAGIPYMVVLHGYQQSHRLHANRPQMRAQMQH